MAIGIMTGQRRGPPPSARNGGGAEVGGRRTGRDGTRQRGAANKNTTSYAIRVGAGRLTSADPECLLGSPSIKEGWKRVNNHLASACRCGLLPIGRQRA